MELRRSFWLRDVFILTDTFKDCLNVFLPLIAKIQEDQIWAECWEAVYPQLLAIQIGDISSQY